MPVVPRANYDVGQDRFDVPVPKFATPVKAAYTGVADANVEAAAGLSKVVTNLADKIEQENIWREQAQIYDDREKLANHATDLMTSSETKKITDSEGNEFEVQAGILNRQGKLAQGSSDEFQQNISPMRDEMLAKYRHPKVQREAARMFDSIVSQGYRQASMHESAQIKEATASSFLSSSINEVKTATQAGNPDDLMGSMEHIHDSYMKYGAFKGLSPEEIQRGVSPMYAKAAENSAMNVLRSTGDLNAAMLQLDTVKTLIPDDYEKIAEGLTRHDDYMSREVDRQGRLNKINSQFGMIADFATPGAQPPTKLDVENMVKSGKVDVEFASDYNSAIKAFDEQRAAPKVDKKGKLIPDSGEVPLSLGIKDSEENIAFASTMKNIMASSSKEEVTTVLQQAMKLAGQNKFSEDKMKLTMFYALQRGNMLNDGMDVARTVSPELSKLDGGVQSLMDFQMKAGGIDSQLYSDFFDALSKNSSPKDAAELAKTNAVLRIDPSVANWDNIPTSIKRSPMTSAVTFKPGTKVYPHARLRESGNAPSP